jgi:hypothetical protein
MLKPFFFLSSFYCLLSKKRLYITVICNPSPKSGYRNLETAKAGGFGRNSCIAIGVFFFFCVVLNGEVDKPAVSFFLFLFLHLGGDLGWRCVCRGGDGDGDGDGDGGDLRGREFKREC